MLYNIEAELERNGVSKQELLQEIKCFKTNDFKMD